MFKSTSAPVPCCCSLPDTLLYILKNREMACQVCSQTGQSCFHLFVLLPLYHHIGAYFSGTLLADSKSIYEAICWRKLTRREGWRSVVPWLPPTCNVAALKFLAICWSGDRENRAKVGTAIVPLTWLHTTQERTCSSAGLLKSRPYHFVYRRLLCYHFFFFACEVTP